MNPATPDDKAAPADRQPDSDSTDTGLPVVRTWKALYFLVLASFALWVALLLWLTRSFS
jgi:hypothetical protein